ncbi:MAG TPA: hypothetical protein DCM54_14665 [Gammaproteobacteria bacterium]|nr:hypothetical protein [Gammaproteobacteria bacterium]|tara:strand:- start:1499 stop:2389 length:891 start_codon:yes stop_codon:yes gene_type:complete
MQTILLTGANGHLGRRLIARFVGEYKVLAIVRSKRAEEGLHASVGELENLTIEVVDYTHEKSLIETIDGCDHAVHLVGVIKSGKGNTYESAHQRPCRVLASAAARVGIKSIVYLSLLGSDSDSDNACLASRGEAEEILIAGSVPSTIVRVPMVLGEDDFASRSLGKKASSKFVVTLRGQSKEQPIYAGDIIEAITQLLGRDTTEVIELAGPESLNRIALIRRASLVTAMDPMIISLPLGVGIAFAWILEILFSAPPITRDMLRILDHDDDVDVSSLAGRLNLDLTPLNRTLEKVLS